MEQIRPNHELAEAERVEKRELKRLLKEQHYHRKLAMRLHKAEQGDAHVVENITRRELQAYQEKTHMIDTSLQFEQETMQQQVKAREFVQQVYHGLQKTWRSAISTSTYSDSSDNVEIDPSTQTVQNGSSQHSRAESIHSHHEYTNGTSVSSSNDHRRQNCSSHPNNLQYTPRVVKERRLVESRVLLRHMAKGTQELPDFASVHALHGYTRHKFIERAMLVVTALAKLERWVCESVAEVEIDSRTKTMMERLWCVKSVASIGCGPGCDAVGVLAFLLNARRPLVDPPSIGEAFDRVILLDFAMPHWQPLLDSVRELLVPAVVRHVETATCDARRSLWEQAPSISQRQDSLNPAVHEVLSLLTTYNQPENGYCKSRYSLTVDMFVVSYLLSETRDKWHIFFDDLVQLSPIGTLFLFTDPTAWQMHVFRRRYEFFKNHKRRMDFVWLDSSMFRPELQELEGRNSPAVLLGMVVSSLVSVSASDG